MCVKSGDYIMWFIIMYDDDNESSGQNFSTKKLDAG